MKNVMKLIKFQFVPFIISLLLLLPARSADITITIYGTVIARPCMPVSSSYIIELGDIALEQLSTQNSGLDWSQFSLDLTQCPLGTSTVSVSFSGQIDSTNPSFYKNNGTASGIALELRTSNDKLVNNGSSIKVNIDTLTKNAQFGLKIRPVLLSSNVTVGTIYTTLTATYKYE